MRHSTLLAALLVTAASLSACVVAPAPYPAGGPYYDSGPVVVANVAPPTPYVEPVPAPPFTGAVWIGGYWGWSGGRHYWVPGRWDHGRPGYTYAPHRWEQRGNHWELHGGGWTRG